MNRRMTIPLVLAITFALAPAVYPQTPSGSQISSNTRLRYVGKNRPAGEVWPQTTLYFGSLKPDGTMVTAEEFNMFLEQQITPRFPDGLTLLVGLGQFQNSAGVIVKERSQVLILLYPPGDDSNNKKIEEIRQIYKSMFQQESVLRVDTAGRVSF